MTKRKKLLLGTLSGLLVVSAAGCNTFRGMGRDIQKGGEAVEHAADEVEEDL